MSTTQDTTAHNDNIIPDSMTKAFVISLQTIVYYYDELLFAFASKLLSAFVIPFDQSYIDLNQS